MDYGFQQHPRSIHLKTNDSLVFLILTLEHTRHKNFSMHLELATCVSITSQTFPSLVNSYYDTPASACLI